MTFDEILPLVKEGARVRRAVWEGVRHGVWMELVHVHADDGREADPILMIGYPGNQPLRLFTGGSWDLLADDWEIL